MRRYLNIIAISVFYLFGLSSLCFSEDITITTYYPSPYGSYNELTTTGNTYLATTSGNVGIGTTNPQALLHIKEDINAWPNQLLIEKNSDNVVGGTPRVGMVDTYLGSVTTAPAWYIDNWKDRFRIFRQPNINTTGVEYFTIANNGNVGIGTPIPSEKLTVYTGNNQGDAIIAIRATGTTGGQFNKAKLYLSSAGASPWEVWHDSGLNGLIFTRGGTIVFSFEIATAMSASGRRARERSWMLQATLKSQTAHREIRRF